MKKTILLAATFFVLTSAFSQDNDSALPRIDKNTLYSTTGYKIAENQYVKIGTGSTPDGDFKFIRINSESVFAYNSTTRYQGLENSANAFPRSQAGLKFKIKAVEKRGNKKRGYVYYAKIGRGLINYEIDVDNAIAAGELVVPDEFKPKSKAAPVVVEVKQQFSVADELTKLKKLFDDAVLTSEEYEIQKKKLLEKN